MSMKNLLRRVTTAANEAGPQACGPAEARFHIAPRFRAVLSDGEFRDGLQDGDAK